MRLPPNETAARPPASSSLSSSLAEAEAEAEARTRRPPPPPRDERAASSSSFASASARDRDCATALPSFFCTPPIRRVALVCDRNVAPRPSLSCRAGRSASTSSTPYHERHSRSLALSPSQPLTTSNATPFAYTSTSGSPSRRSSIAASEAVRASRDARGEGGERDQTDIILRTFSVERAKQRVS